MTIAAETARPGALHDLYGISRATAYRLLAAGEIDAVKSGHATLIILDSVRAYLARQPKATFRPTHNRALAPAVTKAA